MPPNLLIDQSYNQLVNNTTVQGLGYVEQISPESLNLDIYRFIIASIRKEDEKNGLFLKRFLEGPQKIWEAIQDRIFDVKDLWDVSKIDDEHLQYLQSIVGWVGQLTKITDALDSDTLRRLISTSVALWKERGLEEAITDVLSLTTQARSRIWNWFDTRWILGENSLVEEHNGYDSNLISLPGSPDFEEYYSNLRIVDDGNLDRALVKNLLKLMRPCSERYTITYVNFMDLFLTDDDKTQWAEHLGTLSVAEGTAKLTDVTIDEQVYTPLGLPVGSGGPGWTKQVIYARVKVPTMGLFKFVGLTFADDGTGNNFYSFAIEPKTNTIIWYSTIGGVFTNFNFVYYDQWGELLEDVWYGLRIDFQSPNIKMYLDNDLILDVNDSDLTEGTIGFFHSPGSTIEVDEIEMFLLPLEIEEVDINE